MKQVQDVYESKLKIGESKYACKKDGTYTDYIFSYSTFRTYMKEACYFVNFCKEKYGCRTLEQCRAHVRDWMKTRSKLSPYTQKLDLAALAKLYGVTSEDFGVITPERRRSRITRSRGIKIRDKHFSEERNAGIVYFCRCTGLRRSELSMLRGNMLTTDERGRLCINITGNMAKGGRERKAPIIGDADRIVKMMTDAGNEKVFPKVPSNMDVHSYRAEYATSVYLMYAREIKDIPFDKKSTSGRKYQSDVYICRGDEKGKRYDKKAMLEASNALGHNRISVVGEHYLRI